MKKPLLSAVAAISACFCIAASAFGAEPPRNGFGKGNPFRVEELPAGKLKTNLQSLDLQSRDKAMKWLHTFDFTGLDAAELLRVDNGGGIFIVCPDDQGNFDGHSHGPAKSGKTSGGSGTSGGITPAPDQTTGPSNANAAVPVGSPPVYSSRPGATRHIYLDFNGGIVSGTAWNSSSGVGTYDVKVWSQDADRTTFNDSEQTWMRRVWQRVAEDYAPFEVDVTTDAAYDPDNYTGNKDLVGWVLICETTDNNGVALPHNGSGGIAYVGVFGNSTYSPNYQPAWVTSTNGGGNEAIIAEAAAHEMGHNMGLSHDGYPDPDPANPNDGNGAYYGGHVAVAGVAPSWGPIMGTGYNRNVSQWSKGEYYGATQLQDDLSIISARVPYRTDDYGDNFASATACVASNNTISQSGVVETTNDPDVFSFTTGVGAISFTASSFHCDADTWGSNLDIQLELYDSSQTLISSSNPAADVNASISTTIASAGTYYLVLKPSAAGTPLVSGPSGYTVYGSLGQYTISGTVQPFDPPLALTGISPSSGNAGSTVTVDISGTKLSATTAVKLKQTGRSDIVGTSGEMIGSTLRCQFNLAGAASGSWDLVATNPDLATATLPAAFTVIAVPTTLWSENFDGTVTGWTSQAVSGTANSWSVTTAQSYSPTKSYFAAGPSSTSVAHLISPSISIPSGPTNLKIEFWQRYDLQSGRDGGRLSLSIDGGSWFDVTDSGSGAAFTLNGYNITMATTGQSGPFAGLQAWSGINNTFAKTVISLSDLTKYAGKNLRMRWEIATNNQTASNGWYVDSVSLLGDYTLPNQNPVITVAASTSSAETQTDGANTYQIIRGTGTNLSVTATDDAGESYLTYTWQSMGPAPVVFPVNGNNAAKSAAATFSTTGDYVITVTATDTGSLSTTSSINVRVLPTDSLTVTPNPGSLTVGNTLQFSAVARDQFGTLLASQPAPINWSANGGGSIDSSGLFTATNAGGPFTITATSGATYFATAQVTVNPLAATVALGNLNQTYDGSSKSVSVTTTPSGLSNAVTYNGSSTAPTNAGTYAVVAAITDPNYTGSTSGSLVISKASQSINFAALDPIADDQPSFALTATATSGLTVSYTSSNTAVATVAGDTVTVVGLGTTTITASQAGNVNYSAATSVPRTLTIVRSNPLAVVTGGPYRVLIGQSLSLLNGSASQPSDGATLTTYEWDLNNDNLFGDVTGATPSAISYAALTGMWGMVQGLNTVKLKVTDSASKTSIVSTTVEIVLNLTWDSNGTTSGQTNGAGAWLDANLWWDGLTNQTWASGSSAIFGGPSTAGGAVSLASPTTVNVITFNTFTGTYTLGSVGQTITLNGGIAKNSGSGVATISSPITLGAAQTWTNNSSGLLTASATVNNGGYLLTMDGSGNTTSSGGITGAGGLQKNGSGTLTFGGNNDFSGGLVINGGGVTDGSVLSSDSLGAANSSVTVNANTTLTLSNSITTIAKDVLLNNNAVVSFVTGGGSPRNITGDVTGTGGIALNTMGSLGQRTMTLSSTSNTFSGPITQATGNFADLIVNSLSDDAGAGAITFGESGQGRTMQLTWGSGATSGLTLNNRQLVVIGTTTAAILNNNNPTAANKVTVNTDLLVSTAGAKTLTLGGSNTGTNTFAGGIANGSGTISVVKSGAGNWALSGTNTYSGTTVNAFSNPATGSLIFQGMQALSPSTTLSQTHPGGVGGFCTIKLLDDASSPAARTGVNLAMSASNTSHTMPLFVGNNNTANGGSSSGTNTGGRISLGNLNITQASTGNTSQTLAVTGANGYGLQINNVNITLMAGASTWTGIINPTSAPVTIAGNVQQAAGSAGTSTLQLDGTATGNQITGNILNSADGAPKMLSVTKTNGGTWTLSGNNSFGGGLVLSGAVAGSQLNINSANALGTGSFTINSGNNAKFDNTSGSAITLANNNSQTWSNDFTFVGSYNLNMGTGAVTMGGSRNVTVSANTLTVGGAISGSGFSLTKAGGGTLIIGGANTYTGTTNVSAGKLFINGDSSAASGAINVGANATLGGTGILGGNTTIAANGRLEFDLSTSFTTHNSLELATGRSLAFSGASVLTITSSGSPSPGDYTLISAPGGFGSSVPPATVNLPAGWTANAPRFVGTELKIYITSAGGIDATPPTLFSITDDRSGGLIPGNTLITYTITFSEDMDDSSITAGDFGNVGTSACTIGSVTETSPGVFTVQATPTSTGTFQLQINQNAVLKDVAGNNLNTASAIPDDIIFTVDGTAPTVVGIADDRSGGPIPVNTLVTYTVAFSEDMDASTVTATDFGNAGTATVTIGSVAETSPTSGVFIVRATPTSAGTLQLEINAATVIRDLAGNNLNTTSAITDDTTLTVDGTPPTLLSLTDDKTGSSVAVNTLVTYTVIFNEDMDATSVSASDFGNAGTAPVTIGAVSETLPGIFTVQATPTHAGTLQLRINQSAVLKDVAGNNLNTGSSIADDTIITVDGTAPTLVSITDDKSGGQISVNTLVTYTLTFSEDMDASTVTAAVFGNAGTSAVTIGAVTETSPTSGIFTVQVTSTSAGTLQIKVNAAAVLKDIAGNNLDTTSALTDDTTITVDGTAPTLVSITDDKSGGPVFVNTLVTYTVTFSEDMDASTVTAAVFGNAGASAVTIGAVTETSPTSGVFTVQATPTTTGNLQLKIAAAAVLKDLAGNNMDTASAIPDDTTLTVQGTSYASWAAGKGLAGDDALEGANPDFDMLTNLQEYAFGTNPMSPVSGSIAYVPGGEVTSPGLPVALNLATGGGMDFRAVFGRRKDYQTAGLHYTVQFSAGLDVWVDSSVSPAVLTGESGAGDMEAVGVPFPSSIPVGSGFETPTYFRVGVSSDATP